MKVAVIAPVPQLSRYATLSTDYHLTLSHLVKKSPKYAEFYSDQSKAGHFIILDNSAHEVGVGDPFEDLIGCAIKIGASEIVLPDRLFFGDDTYQLSREAYYKLRDALPETSLMGVPQGRTLSEWTVCATRLVDLGVDCIGISKDYEVWPGGLLGLVKIIRNLGPQIAIHLLGWGRDGGQLHTLSRTPGLNIRGIDSAKPLVYAQAGIKLEWPSKSTKDHIPPYPRRQPDFFSLESFPSPSLAAHNIQVFKDYANYHPPMLGVVRYILEGKEND